MIEMVYIKEKDGQFKREVSLFDLILFGIGSTIGAGIFILIGLGADIAGTDFILSFIVGAIISIIIVLNYAELGSSMPITGGGYSFVKEGLGGIIAFYVGWLIWLGTLVYSALSAVGFVRYLNYFLPFTFPDLVGAVVVIAFALLNMKGIKQAIKFQKIITIILLCIFAVYIFTGLGKVKIENFNTMMPGSFPSVLAGTALIFVCFIGFDSITSISEEVKKPKHIAIALILSVLIPGLIYTVVSYITLGSVPLTTLINSKVPLIELVKDNTFLIGLILLGAILATLSSLNVSLIAASRNLFALSRDGYMPDAFASLSEKYKNPYLAIIFCAFIIIMFIATRAISFIAYVSGFGYIIGISLVCLSLIILREKRKFLHRPFKLPHYEIFAFLGFILPLMLLPFLESTAILVGLVWMVIGFFIYCLHTLGIDRFRIAFTGVNILISIISLTFWYSLQISFYSLKHSTKIFLGYTSLIISLICFVVGILFLKKVKTPSQREKNQKS